MQRKEKVKSVYVYRIAGQSIMSQQVRPARRPAQTIAQGVTWRVIWGACNWKSFQVLSRSLGWVQVKSEELGSEQGKGTELPE